MIKMEYSINELRNCKDKNIKILSWNKFTEPKRINSSRYRIYGKYEIDKLQQILFYKSMGFKLEDIKI